MSNNNKKNMQPNTASEGDNTINTKKGFLISFPAKKKNDEETSSGIVMAKTVNNAEKKNVSSHDKNSGNDGGNNGKGKDRPRHDGKNKNSGKNNANEQNKQEKNLKPQNNQQNNNQHNNNNSNQQKNNQNHKKNDKNQKKNDKNINNNQNQNQKVQNNNQQSKKNQTEQKNQAEHQKNQDHQKPRNDRRDRDRRNDRSDRNNHHGNQGKKIDLPGLSPLSNDMRDYAKISAADIAKSAESTTKEPSLEEKYKNAIPLADQIAAEEAKRKFKPRSMVTNKIDRSVTGNAELEAAAKQVEGNPDAQIKIPDTSKNFEVVGIRFREAGKIYYFDPNGKDIPYGTPVIVETARGAEYGYTAISNRLVPASSVIPPLKKIKRIATEADTEKYVANKSLETDAAEIFKSKVASLGLEMNLIFVEYTFDNSKLLFYFTAETRIDFRELVKELASVFRTRIELRQIGVRDEAKMLGGLGVCGRSVCCNSFLGDFAQVSIKMAKDQGLSLNSAKISGACGKLMCCLRYEDKVYEEEIARTPKVGSVVETSEGKGIVTEALPLKGIVKVTLEATPEAPPKPFDREDVKVVGFNKAAVKEDAEEMKKLKALEDNN
jgi:cell fate regulator YaaT (PSP1 superfamily)